VLLALLAEVAIQLFELHDSIAPPSKTLPALGEGISSGELSGALRTTLEAYLGGLALAIVVGVVLGVLIGSSRPLLDASFVVLEFLRPIPAVALIPLAFLSSGRASRCAVTSSRTPLSGRSSSTPSMACAARIASCTRSLWPPE